MTNFNFERVPDEKRDYFILVWMVVLHGVALVGAPLTFSWGAAAVGFALYLLSGCVGITFGFHRLLTHRSLETPKWIERTAATFGTLALQGSPLEWVAHHRMHHASSDTDMDPHNAVDGFWHSHMGWMLKKVPRFDDPARLKKFGRDILADPYLRFLSRPGVMIGLQLALGLALLAIGGISYVIWGIAVRLVVLYHVTWFVNSAAHLWGYKNYGDPVLARNNWWVGILAFGEGWHNNHHADPEGVHVSHRWWEFDLTWQLIKLLRKLGLATDLRMPRVADTRVDLQGAESS